MSTDENFVLYCITYAQNFSWGVVLCTSPTHGVLLTYMYNMITYMFTPILKGLATGLTYC